MALEIVLVATSPSEGWQGPSGLFQAAAQSLAMQGHVVRLIDHHVLADLAQGPPLLTGLNRAVAASPMTDSHRLALELARKPPDLMIAPLRGGIAQATLMARACGEAFAGTRIALWSNEPTRERFLASDSAIFDLGSLISDAMERQCLALADALILPDQTMEAPALPGLDLRIPLVRCSRPTGAVPPAPPQTPVRELVFMGALQRVAGAGEFVEAIERLARKGILGDRLVTFLGPMADSRYGLSKEWLGQKATTWPFRFKVIDETDRSRALRYAAEPGRLGVSVSADGGDLHSLRAGTSNHLFLHARAMENPHLATRLAEGIARAIDDGGAVAAEGNNIDWAKLLADLTRLDVPSRPSGTQTVTVCVAWASCVRPWPPFPRRSTGMRSRSW